MSKYDGIVVYPSVSCAPSLKRVKYHSVLSCSVFEVVFCCTTPRKLIANLLRCIHDAILVSGTLIPSAIVFARALVGICFFVFCQEKVIN